MRKNKETYLGKGFRVKWLLGVITLLAIPFIPFIIGIFVGIWIAQ